VPESSESKPDGVVLAYLRNEGGEAHGAGALRRATLPSYLWSAFSTPHLRK